jgi:hypothetical protein
MSITDQSIVAWSIVKHDARKIAVSEMQTTIQQLNKDALDLHPKNDEKLFTRRHLYIIQMSILQDIINFPHKYLVWDINGQLQEKTKELVNSMMWLPAKPQWIFDTIKQKIWL